MALVADCFADTFISGTVPSLTTSSSASAFLASSVDKSSIILALILNPNRNFSYISKTPLFPFLVHIPPLSGVSTTYCKIFLIFLVLLYTTDSSSIFEAFASFVASKDCISFNNLFSSLKVSSPTFLISLLAKAIA